ncbi:hypothetical protein A2U01_0062717 [Trifolium medium]|uniref:Uncharacterized protein n=1 Tax=Trifolium medium TaxID=97028 RepID=A0A392RZH6_9FABA|nr:hypothetical protein [Trifolium medium]
MGEIGASGNRKSISLSGHCGPNSGPLIPVLSPSVLRLLSLVAHVCFLGVRPRVGGSGEWARYLRGDSF